MWKKPAAASSSGPTPAVGGQSQKEARRSSSEPISGKAGPRDETSPAPSSSSPVRGRSWPRICPSTWSWSRTWPHRQWGLWCSCWVPLLAAQRLSSGSQHKHLVLSSGPIERISALTRSAALSWNVPSGLRALDAWALPGNSGGLHPKLLANGQAPSWVWECPGGLSLSGRG